jgi:predicted DNA-binding transcriptional regulator AlpA
MPNGMLEPRSGSPDAAARIPERLWNVEETARFLDLSVNTLYQHNHKKTGPRSYRVGRYCRYDPADVMAWLAEHASDAGQQASPVSPAAGVDATRAETAAPVPGSGG